MQPAVLAPKTGQSVAPVEKHLPEAHAVHDILDRHILADGFDMVLDMQHSRGAHLRDAKTGRDYVDFFTFFASNPLGMNHPKLSGDSADTKAFQARLMDAALNKPSNSDVYTRHMARFVDTFARVGIPDQLPNAFFVSGGALAVENTLKVAFDWKVRMNHRKGYRREVGHKVLHFEKAFHGRSGYTMSLTNTDPNKVKYFPKFDWPRLSTPVANGPAHMDDVEQREALALAQAKTYFREHRDDIACVIVEPIQGEGGDNHLRPVFLQALKDLAHENDALLIFDEVQTGVGLTGTFWAWQGLGVTPDLLAFGKKAQVCGVLAGGRVSEVDDNVFNISSRINSTWGGNLVDMVRFDRILEVIEQDNLVGNAWHVGSYLLQRLHAMAEAHDVVANPRGRGLMCAFDLPTAELRNAVRHRAYDLGLIILGCGANTLRFRPALTVTEADIDQGLDILAQAMKQTV
ncbi:MAG: L-lysine 6-transaminase [Bacteroidota bacterium]